MAYKANIVVNPSAETEDMTGWDSANVTVEGGTTPIIGLKVKIGDSFVILWGGWMDDYKPKLSYIGDDDTHYFLLASDANMDQAILSGFEVDFKDGKLICRFKFVTAQELWDATVIGIACADIIYDDESISKFIIPCVKGITFTGRNQLNSWIREEAICQ